jgi:hypothetical protein
VASFNSIIASGQQAIAACAGVSVVYSDGTNWTRITATPGKTDFELVDDSGAISQFRSRDYIVMAADLVLNWVMVTPQRGHTITEQIGKQLHKYEVSRPDGSEQPYRYSSTGNNVLRIHTKLKAVANA